MKKPLFEGLIYDEFDRLVTTNVVGGDPCYVVDDDGFHRHISSENVDRQVLGCYDRFDKRAMRIF